jgi:hypothetical protein
VSPVEERPSVDPMLMPEDLAFAGVPWTEPLPGPHVLEVVECEDGDRPQFFARCSCGPEGPERDSEEEAYADYQAHLALVESTAAGQAV